MTPQQPKQERRLLLTPALLEEAKGWILDCKESFRDIDTREDVDELTQAEIEAGLEIHYSGGLKQFIAACAPLKESHQAFQNY